jgi:deoxycytidylate deaminase
MPRKRFHIEAFTFDKKGKFISRGTNDYHRSHPLMKHFALKAKEPEHKCWLHAEVSALLNARGKSVHTVFVQRFAADGTYALAKPCKKCYEAIKAFGVSSVKYTTNTGVEEIKVQTQK